MKALRQNYEPTSLIDIYEIIASRGRFGLELKGETYKLRFSPDSMKRTDRSVGHWEFWFGSYPEPDYRILEDNEASRGEVDVELIRSWIQDCECRHDCGEAPSEQATGLMLIDVLTREVVRAPPASRYFALSYVWGDVTREAASGLVSSSAGCRLPNQAKKTIEDAITLMKRLGERYLWVDVYCVDQHNAQKQKQQINQMDSIFQGAALTIVALSGGSASAGLAGISRTTGPRQFFAHLRRRGS